VRRLALLPSLLLLATCAARDAGQAEDARTRLVGLRADDLRLCAGPSDKKEESAGGEFWTYDRNPPASGVSVPVPVAGGNVNLSSGGICRATFQLVDGRVTRISLTGANELGIAREAACAPIVQACLRMVREGTVRVD
jgi:hypothetical protein